MQNYLSLRRNQLLCKGKIAELVKQAKHDPVIVMFDDRASERVEERPGKMPRPEIEIIGALAVASNTDATGIKCDYA